MSVPPIPPPFDQVGQRPFSFYPPILGVEHNEWLFRRATWSEILVYNTRLNVDVWVPRRFLGEASRIDEPVMIVGLNKELEFKAGSVWPHERRVIQMPRAVNYGPVSPVQEDAPPSPAPVLGIRVESSPESRIGRLIVVSLAIGLSACILVGVVVRTGAHRPRISSSAKDQSCLDLSRNDDFFAVVRKLGQPMRDRWLSESGELQFRALSYPDRGYTVVLMGDGREAARYIGALDQDWQVIHSVDIGTSANTASMLRSLKKF
jgi:hypothetical protein